MKLGIFAERYYHAQALANRWGLDEDLWDYIRDEFSLDGVRSNTIWVEPSAHRRGDYQQIVDKARHRGFRIISAPEH